MKKELVYVTSNEGKFAEVASYIERRVPGVTITQFAADIPEIQSDDQELVARDKALKAWELVKKPLIIDDAAIYFTRYNRFPGVLSKFVSLGIGFDGIKRLIFDGDRAYFLLYMIYVDGPDSMHIFEGRCDGALKIPDVQLAHPSLPYDDFFVPDEQVVNQALLTYAEMKLDVGYDSYYYRIRALKKLVHWLLEQQK